MDNTIERCPICEPVSYYAGKSGMDEVDGAVCGFCQAELNPIALRFDAVHGTDYFPITTAIVQCVDHADAFSIALPEGFSIIEAGMNLQFFKNPAVKLPIAALEGGE